MKTLTTHVIVALLTVTGFCAEKPYLIVGTGQTKCYDNRNEIAPPKPGQPFYGQDARHRGTQPTYKLSADGLTVHDNNTGLIWQRSPDTNGDGALTPKPAYFFFHV